MLFLAAPTTMLLSAQVWAFANRTPGVVLLHAWLARIGVLLALLMGGLSAGFGIAGIRARPRNAGTSRLAIAGLLVSAIAIAVWLITSVCLLNTTESLLLIYGRKN
jgi:hypothetical protein